MDKKLTDLTEEDKEKLLSESLGAFRYEDMKKVRACIYWIETNTQADYMTLTDGEPRIGTQLELRPDIYSVAFVYQLKRCFVEDEASDEEDIRSLYRYPSLNANADPTD